MDKHETMRTRVTLLQRIGDIDDKHAWYEFVFYYQGYIHAILKKMGISHHDTEEISQQVLLKISKSIGSFEYDANRGRFRGYLARITINTAHNYFRSTRPEVSLSDNPELSGVFDDLQESPAIDRLAEEEWNQHLYRLAWRNVSVSFGETVKKVWNMLCDGETPEKVASTLDLSVSSVYVYKKRIAEKMKPELKRLGQELE